MQNHHFGRMLKSRWLASIFLSVSLLPVFVSLCAAQEPAARAQGYFFVAPGLRTHEEYISGLTHLGGGAEVFIHKGLAAGAEIGYLRPWPPADSFEDIGMLSLDASYHMPKSHKLTYFILAGVSFGLRDRTLNNPHPSIPDQVSSYIAETLTLLNFGFGGTYWFKGRTGFRFEIRDHLYTAETDRHYLELRFALALR